MGSPGGAASPTSKQREGSEAEAAQGQPSLSPSSLAQSLAAERRRADRLEARCRSLTARVQELTQELDTTKAVLAKERKKYGGADGAEGGPPAAARAALGELTAGAAASPHKAHRGFGGYLIRSDERTLFHCGDSSMFDGFQEIGRRADIDLALMPIGAYQAPSGRPVHMNPEEALDAFEMMGARHMVPMHHDTFPLGGEPLHEPAEWLARSACQRGLDARVRLLHEGETALY